MTVCLSFLTSDVFLFFTLMFIIRVFMNTGRWQLIEPVFKAILMHFIEEVIVLCFYTFYVQFYYMFHWIVLCMYVCV